MVTRIALAVALAATAGCYAPTFRDCELQCGSQRACPDGFECAGQVCRPIGATQACPPGLIDAPMIDALTTPHPSTPWGGDVQAIAVTNGLREPSLTDDRLELYATSGTDLVVSTRTATDGLWNLFQTASGVLNTTISADIDNTAYLSADGLTMHWTSSRAGGLGGNDIWRATRPTRGSPWVGAVAVTELSSSSEDSGGSVSADGRMIVIASNRFTATGADLYYATRASSSGPWGTPSRITELNSGSNESHPILSPDKLTIYFHSDRFAGADLDLYEAHRPTDTVQFGAPRRLTELSTATDDGDPWVSGDGRHMFFSRLAGGQQAIFEASR